MKRVLLVAGGGTLGTYTAKELLGKDCLVDVICLEDKVSNNERLTFYKGRATPQYLKEFFADKRYDGIVNFIHYPDVAEYPPYHEILSSHTKQLIVLSSYRVYADLQHPITETAPRLLDVSRDRKFLETEKYAVSKAKLENYLNAGQKGGNWTVVRPVISFSSRRFDLVTCSGRFIIDKTAKGGTVLLPGPAKDLHAGLDWAGNSGKLIANLLFKEETLGETYTVSSAQNLTWGEVADCYKELVGANIEWVSLEEYQSVTKQFENYALLYDRLFDRVIDNAKILKATGLTKSDFLPIREGIKTELELLKG